MDWTEVLQTNRVTLFFNDDDFGLGLLENHQIVLKNSVGHLLTNSIRKRMTVQGTVQYNWAIPTQHQLWYVHMLLFICTTKFVVFFREQKLADLKKTSFWLPCFQPEKGDTVRTVVDELVVWLRYFVVFISSSDTIYLLLWVIICSSQIALLTVGTLYGYNGVVNWLEHSIHFTLAANNNNTIYVWCRSCFHHKEDHSAQWVVLLYEPKISYLLL